MFKVTTKPKDENEILREKVTQSSILSAYKTRKQEIKSLREYDRGEKEIVAPDLADFVRGI